jgi:hypothetical protein
LLRIASEFPQPVGSLEMHLQVTVAVSKATAEFILHPSLERDIILLDFIKTNNFDWLLS